MDEALLLSNFGDRLRTSRLALGLSQEKLALDCGLDRTYISSVERGGRNISILSVLRIAQALKTSASELCEGIDR